MRAQPTEAAPAGALESLNRLFVRALLELGHIGLDDAACRLAGQGWALLRRENSREAERLNAVLHSLTRARSRLENREQKETTMTNQTVLDVRELPPPQRHALIFQTYEKLGGGEGFILVNDHDPKPLYYQFQAEKPGQVSWDYLESGPAVWRVRIGRQ